MRAHLIAIGLLALTFFIGLGDTGVVDFDEACYAEVARTMFLRGDYIIPELNGEPFFEKPPLLYWTETLGFHLFGVGSLGVRFLNAVSAGALLISLYLFARRPLGAPTALLASLILASTVEFAILARVSLTDLWLTLWLTLCLGGFHRACERERAGGSATAWIVFAAACAGLAMLTKGVIGIALPGAAFLAYLAWERRLALALRLRWIGTGLAVALGLGLSWYLLLGLAHEGAFAFLRELFLEHHVGRFTKPMQGHGGSPLYYVPVLVAGFLPWSPFLILALTRGGLRSALDSRGRLLRLFTAFAAVTFLFFSLAATKLPSYIAPLIPAAALLVANFWTQDVGDVWRGRAPAWAIGAVAASWMLFGICFAALPLLVPHVPAWIGDAARKAPGLLEPLDLGYAPMAIGALAIAAGVAILVLQRRVTRYALGCVVAGGAWLTLFATATILFPKYDAHFAAPLRAAAHCAAAHTALHDTLVLVGIKHAPSINFYSDRKTRYVSPRNPEKIAELFEGDAPEIGITARGNMEMLASRGSVEEIWQGGGYAVFRTLPRRR